MEKASREMVKGFLQEEKDIMRNHTKVIKSRAGALAGVAQWIECRLENQGAACLIPRQGTCLGCGPGPQ